jgi:glycosyltransferase involved in cell wall biosynthesis
MRLAVFAEYLPPRLGSDRRIFEIMKRLASENEVHFIVFPPFRELRDELLRKERGSQSRSREEQGRVKCEGINGHLITISPRVALLWQRSLIAAYCLTAIAVFLKSIRVLKEISPEVIVLNYPSPYTGLLGFFVGKLWRKRVVVDFNDLIAEYTGALLNLGKESFTSKLLTLVQDYIVRNSEKTIAPTFFIKDYATLLGVSERKIAVVPNGVDTRSFDPNRSSDVSPEDFLCPSGERRCVYCGRLDAWAGVNIISKLCEAAKAKELHVKFLLAGSGGRELAEKENVVYVGEISYEKVPDFLAVADVVLVPFPDNEVSHAASPLKLFEGMSMQKPVIASRVSGIQEVIVDGENGFLADPSKIEEWMFKLQVILESETLAARVGACARKTVEKGYDWAVLAKRYEEILNAVCLE